MSFEGIPATIVNHGPDAEPASSELATQLEQYKGRPLADKMLEFSTDDLKKLEADIFNDHNVGYGILDFSKDDGMTSDVVTQITEKMRDYLASPNSEKAKEIASILNKI